MHSVQLPAILEYCIIYLRQRRKYMRLPAMSVLTLCLPCVALPWGQPAWQGLGFSGLVHKETHPCGSNFIQSVFKTIQTRCIDSVLIQIVPFVNNTIWKKYFLTSILNLTLHIFLLWPRKPLSLPSRVRDSLVTRAACWILSFPLKMKAKCSIYSAEIHWDIASLNQLRAQKEIMFQKLDHCVFLGRWMQMKIFYAEILGHMQWREDSAWPRRVRRQHSNAGARYCNSVRPSVRLSVCPSVMLRYWIETA